MATFTNQATLSYNGNLTNSNIVTGQLIEVLSATKTAVLDSYTANDNVTYVISIVNSGSTAFTGLSLSDNLGAYSFGSGTIVPLTYVNGSILYYSNGILQAAPVIGEGSALTVNGISVPANGNVLIIYEVTTNQFAPLATDASIINTAVISGGGLSTPIEVTETITTQNSALLTISKAMSPTTITENGQITYTFTIQNSGNTAAVVSDNVIVTDTFDPILDPISVTFNGVAWTQSTNYTYNTTTGDFATVAGQITVPAATYIQDSTTGSWLINPGVSTLVVTGTV